MKNAAFLILLSLLLAGCIDPSPQPTTSSLPSTTSTSLPEDMVSLIIISDASCPDCDTTAALKSLRKIFPDMSVSYLDIQEEEAKSLVTEYGIEFLPAYILSSNIAEDEGFSEVDHYFEKKAGGYLLKPEATLSTWVADPVAREKKLEATRACIASYNISPETVIFLYSDRCAYCSLMKPRVGALENESYSFLWAEYRSGENMESVRDCLTDIVSGSVPEFVCAGSLETMTGAGSVEELREFVDSCGD